MAYRPRNAITRPPKGSRIVHRRASMLIDAGGAGAAQVSIPSAGRLIALKTSAVTTGSTVVIKADTSNGVQIYTKAVGTGIALTPVGTTAVDEGRAATAATDAFGGGFPVRGGAYLTLTSGTEAERLNVDMWFHLDTYAKVVLDPLGSAGTAAVTSSLRLHSAGRLVALAIDFTSQAVTTDVVIKADDTNGTTLFTSTDSTTDLAPSLLGRPGADEGGAASAATDGTECGNVFTQGLYFDVAQADPSTGNKSIIVECWID